MSYMDDAWLAGFTDGEASFMLVLKRNHRRVGGKRVGWEVVGVQPRFQIGLRADDVAILDGLRAEFGGTVRLADRGSTGQGNRAPRYLWDVGGKADLLRLVAYFDRFPLRAKKARDYVLWRRAVVLYAKHGPRHEELPVLREALTGGRTYDSSVVELRAVV